VLVNAAPPVGAAAAAAAAPAAAAAVARARAVLAAVPDPEIPVLSVIDLGIIRAVESQPDGTLRVAVTPTYSGCPATAVIRADIATALEQGGFGQVRIVDVLAPPWTSDWISAEGRRKLAAYGIAPPPEPVASLRALRDPGRHVECPRCGARDTELLSEFGSTPCKSLHRCRACREPFDSFKCL
jgi:ring-1,2-phenylacetyl-CoA epoxidase subunit PaaD